MLMVIRMSMYLDQKKQNFYKANIFKYLLNINILSNIKSYFLEVGCLLRKKYNLRY